MAGVLGWQVRSLLSSVSALFSNYLSGQEKTPVSVGGCTRVARWCVWLDPGAGKRGTSALAYDELPTDGHDYAG